MTDTETQSMELAEYPILEEYPLLSNFTKRIPSQAQKGLSSFDIDFTCIGVDGHYIAVGTSVGIVYLYDRRKNYLSRLKIGQKEIITSIKVLISLECLVVFGTRNGCIFVFKVPFDEKEELEKFTVEGLHDSEVTALEWAKNGLKFFSGDANGVIVCTEIDHLEHQCRSRVLMKEDSKVVQLSYSKLHLVVSTSFRSLVYSVEDDSTSNIGQKERKCFGPFGAIIHHKDTSVDGTVFASRPGQRLWKSDKSGTIHETMIFKKALSQNHTLIPMLTSKTQTHSNFSDFQFGQLHLYLEKYVLVSSDTTLVLIDPKQKCIVASCPDLLPIIDVCTSGDEIFILRGLRDVIRIAPNIDPYPCEPAPEEPSIMEEILIPLKELGTFVKEHTDSFALPSPENTTIFSWLKKKRSASTPPSLSEANGNEILPDIVQLKPKDFTAMVVDEKSPPPPPVFDIPKINIEIKEGDVDDIVYKPKKKKNKKVRFSSRSPKEDRKSVDQTPIQNEPNVDTKSAISIDNDSKDCDTSSEKSADDIPGIMGDPPEILLNGNSSVFIENNDDNSKCLIPEENCNKNDIVSECDNYISESNGSKDLDNSCVLDHVDGGDTANTVTNTVETDISRLNIDEDDDIYSLRHSVKQTDADNQSTTSEESSSAPSEVTEDSRQKYGTDWVQYSGPDLLTDLSVSNCHLYCADVKNNLYYSKYPVLGLRWFKLGQPAEKVAVSPSESIVWVLYKGTVYAAVQKDKVVWKNSEWLSVAREVMSISVGDDCGWYITNSGQLMIQPSITSTAPFGYPEKVHCATNLIEVSYREGIVWVLTANNSLFCCSVLNSLRKPTWKKMNLDAGIDISHIFLGVHQTGWIAGSNGIIRFYVGVTSDSPEGIGRSWEVEASAYLVHCSNYLQNSVMNLLNNETISQLLMAKKQHICLSTSQQGVWFCRTLDNLLFCNRTDIVGHLWDSVVPVGTSVSTKWNLLSASGVCGSQGSIWCSTSNGELFCIPISSKTPIAVELQWIESIQSLVPSWLSLWVLTEYGRIFVRRGITPNCPEGNRWQQLNLAQLASDQILSISCAPQVVWACTAENSVLVRLGTLCPSNERKLPQAWIPLGAESEDEDLAQTERNIVRKMSSIGKRFPLPIVHPSYVDVIFCKVYVGPLGHPVWSLDSKGNVYVREEASNSFPIGKKWIHIPELKGKHLCISRNAVWLLKYSGNIYRRFGITEKNPCGDCWKQIPGNLDFLSVTEDDELWGLKDHMIYSHSSFLLNCVAKSNGKIPVRMISEDDWEDITADDLN